MNSRAETMKSTVYMAEVLSEVIESSEMRARESFGWSKDGSDYGV